MTQKVLVVLGAGASHDVWDGHSPLSNPQWKPPLAVSLFDFSKNPHYYDVAKPYAGATALGIEMATLAAKSGFDLEAKLREYARHKDARVVRWFRDIPPYLRDLLLLAGRAYVQIPGCYTLLAKRLMLDAGHSVSFVVLNYDRLLEDALSTSFGYSFATFDDYISPRNPGLVVKIHGSVDWFMRTGKSSELWQSCADTYDPLVPRRGHCSGPASRQFSGMRSVRPSCASMAPPTT